MKKVYRIYLIGGILLTSALFSYGTKYPTHLYSPGDLAKAHSEITDCKSCHKSFGGVQSNLCMNAQCHPVHKITDASKATGSLHSRSREDCSLCHTEHKGVSGKITIDFEHKLLGKDMEACFSCHQKDFDRAHQGKYGKDCMLCHTTKEWETGTVNHQKFVQSACIDCHTGPVDELHRSAGNLCQNCHTTNKWSPASFEHAKYFPLTGEHKVSCTTCHEAGNFKKYTCTGCHEHNTLEIKGEHIEEGILSYGDCLRCHNFRMDGRRYGTGKIGMEEEDD